ncbi:Flp pilus assembly complex ATPase component TadA [Pseudomonas fluorescens]|uniref:GspE/PulE family protein n=1 Tax=Pseudomonas fluorescens TaxID=294 RepID=UPI0017867FA1|nr:ATPase, T2SS/T4P/T4SS family [Pseudomonas fluorescens]MBD8089226.1 Flp pilus assembly complex ATPase component TadA [Pseudomonas fluorescens]MBD8615347.1 Flp pilus assembly complex ATPase component TadA [Pseudomonas putida]
MNFFRRNKPEHAPKEDLKQVTATAKQQPAARPNRNQAAYNVLSKKDDIPVHSAVLSVTGGPIELTAEWQKNYAILLTNRDKKEVEVICSLDVIRKAGIDDDYMAIVDRIKRSGYVRAKTKMLAKPEIIQIIYEQLEQKRSVEEQQKAATAIQLEFDELLVSALKARASDIHIEVTRKGAEVKFRVDGALQHFTEWPVRHARTMAGVIYMVIAEEKDTSFDERRDQSAIIDRELGEYGSVRVRLNTLPTYPAGFDMIMRILKMGQSGEKIDLNKLGYSREHLSKVRRGSAKPVGVMMMAGTTGSGKSTSLNAMLSEKIAHHGGRIKVITVEDPPEYLLVGATQVPVVRSRSAAKEGADVNPFASTIRAAMRSDPDVLMIGEVRDHHSADLLIHAVQSGHPVFTTTHASSGIDIVSRLRSNGVPDDVLGSHNFISALMYQTLLKTVCQHCSTDFDHFKKHAQDEADDELVHRVYRYLGQEQAKELRFIHNDGCPHCRKGVTGRTVAAEVILPDAYMLRAFRDRQDSDALMHYAYNGGRFALHHGIAKMLTGQCDIRDVEHKLDLIEALQEMSTSVRFFVASPQYSTFIKVQQEAEEALKLSANDQTSSIILLDQLQEPIILAKPASQPEPVLASAPTAQPKAEPKPLLVDDQVKPTPVVHLKPAEEPVAKTSVADPEPVVASKAAQPAEVVEIVHAPKPVEAETTAAVAPAPSPAPKESAPVTEKPATKPEKVLENTAAIKTTKPEPVRVPVAKKPVVVASTAKPKSEPVPVQTSTEAVVTVSKPEAAPQVLAPVVEAKAAAPTKTAVPAPAPLVSQQPEPAADQLSLIEALLPVLHSEVQRTGIALTGRFFKARLSTTAITAILASENTDEVLRQALQLAFQTLTQAELDVVYQTTAEQLQARIDAKTAVSGESESGSGGRANVAQADEKQTAEAKEVESSPVPAKPLKKVTSLAQKRTAANKEKEKAAEAKPKPARQYKSKLLSTGEKPVVEAPKKEAKTKGDGNVKSMADARAKKPRAPAKKDTSGQDDNK